MDCPARADTGPRIVRLGCRPHERQASRAACAFGIATRAAKARKGKKGVKTAPKPLEKPSLPLFKQFSRETESYYFLAINRRTKGMNLLGAEYQDCFGNAKVDILFSPTVRADRAIARQGLVAFVDWLAAIGAVAVFSLVRADDVEKNAIYASAGFRNSGWMNRQSIGTDASADQILWTRKLT